MLKVMKDKNIIEAPEIVWEHISCNLCGKDKADTYHRESLPYFDTDLDFSIVRCTECGLVYTNPRLTDHNATYLYAGPDDQADIEIHARAKAPIFEGALKEIDRLQKLYGNASLGKLLDIGCGSGHFLNEARNRGYDVKGIEPASMFAEYAIDRFSLDVSCKNILETRFPSDSFDIITAWDVIEHVSDPRSVLEQCANWAKPGGIIALRFPSAIWQKIKGFIFQRILCNNHAAFGATMHLYFFSTKTITKMANDLGLEVVSSRTTPIEKVPGNVFINTIKAISGILFRGFELITGSNIGNLEVYCRKPLKE